MLSFLNNEEALAKELHQELGVNVIIENKDMIINPGNWYWCDKNNHIVARCYYEMRQGINSSISFNIKCNARLAHLLTVFPTH